MNCFRVILWLLLACTEITALSQRMSLEQRRHLWYLASTSNSGWYDKVGSPWVLFTWCFKMYQLEVLKKQYFSLHLYLHKFSTTFVVIDLGRILGNIFFDSSGSIMGTLWCKSANRMAFSLASCSFSNRMHSIGVFFLSITTAAESFLVSWERCFFMYVSTVILCWVWMCLLRRSLSQRISFEHILHLWATAFSTEWSQFPVSPEHGGSPFFCKQ